MRPGLLFVLFGLRALAAGDDAFAFDLTAGPEGYQCLRSVGSLPSFPGVRFSEDVVVSPDGTVLVARGPEGVSAFGPKGLLRSTVALDARALSLVGERLWVRGDGIGIAVVDVSNPDGLRLLGTWRHQPLIEPFLSAGGAGCRALLAEGPRVWVAWSGWLDVYDATDWSQPARLGRFSLPLDVRALRRVGDLLVLEHLGQVSVWNVKDPAQPVPLGPPLAGRVFVDGDDWYLLDAGRLSVLELHEIPSHRSPRAESRGTGLPETPGATSLRDSVTRSPSTPLGTNGGAPAPLINPLGENGVAPAPLLNPVGALDPRTHLVAISGGKVFVHHDPKSIAVLALPSLDFIGALSGNFETGAGPVVRSGATLYLSTRFGGLQWIALDTLRAAAPVRRFAGVPLERNRFHGDIITVTVAPGDSVAKYLRRFQLDEPSPTWDARLEPLVRLNQGTLPNFPTLHAGDVVGVPLPRSLVCRP